MSLINDALKEAQRERSGRGAVNAPGPLVDNLFPYPIARTSARSPWLLIGGTVVAVSLVVSLVVSLGFVARSRRMSQTSPTKAIPVAVNAAAKPKVALPSAPAAPVQSGTAPSGLIAGPKTMAPVVERVAAAPPVAAPSKAAPRPRPQLKQAAEPEVPRVAAIPPTRTAPANPPNAVVAPRTDSATVRLVIDPATNEPADSLFRLAYAEQTKNNLDAAQALYERAIATRRAPAEAYNDYGVLLLGRGNKTAASEMFRQALNRDDKNVEAWVNLGDSFNGLGYHAEAMSAYARANQLDPTRAAVKTRISREYEAIGDTTTARRYLEDAIKANPSDAAAHYALGTYLQRAHDYRGAIKEFQSFVDLTPAEDNQDFVLEMRRHISALRRVAP